MRTIGEIRADCESHGACDYYLARWSACRSKAELFDLACSAEGLGFLARGLHEGWGATVGDLLSIFRAFVNGRYTSVQHRGESDREYDSAIWCGYDGDIDVATTCAGIFGCRGTVTVKPLHVCSIFVDPSCDIEIACPDTSRAAVWTAAGAPVPVVSGKDRIITRRITA